jgi:hypothetical protein
VHSTCTCVCLCMFVCVCVCVCRCPALVAALRFLKGSAPSWGGFSSLPATSTRRSKFTNSNTVHKYKLYTPINAHYMVYYTCTCMWLKIVFFFLLPSYSTSVGQAVKECLDMWCSVDAEVSLEDTSIVLLNDVVCVNFSSDSRLPEGGVCPVLFFSL